MALLPQLSLYLVTVVQLTSSQSIYSIIQNNVCRCGRIEESLTQLMTAMSQLQATVFQQQRDIAELKASIAHTDVTGMLRIQKSDKKTKQLISSH